MSFEDLENTPYPAAPSNPQGPLVPSPSPPPRTNRVAVRWITPVYNQKAVQKEEMREQDGGAGPLKYWEFHGSVAGVVCIGAVDTLSEILIDGETAWRGPLSRTSAAECSTINVDPRRVVRFYWGTETQPVDPLLAADGNCFGHEHRSYKGICYILLVNFLFGRERTSPPNIEVVISRKPQENAFSNGVAGLFEAQALPITTLTNVFRFPSALGFRDF